MTRYVADSLQDLDGLYPLLLQPTHEPLTGPCRGHSDSPSFFRPFHFANQSASFETASCRVRSTLSGLTATAPLSTA